MSIKDIQTQLGITADGAWGNQSQAALEKSLNAGIQIKLSNNIYLSEVIASRTALKNRIDNTPNGIILQNLTESAENLWQKVRELLGVPMLITSGYRCPRLNKLAGGVPTSAHQYGYAIDFHAPAFGSPAKIVEFLKHEMPKHGLAFDQIIIEFPSSPNAWVHLAYKNANGQQRGRALQIGG